MELLRFATAGSVDDGKSTLIGRLLLDTKQIFEDQLESVERTSRDRGFEYTNLALLTDGLRAEREQGITIDVAYRYFARRPGVGAHRRPQGSARTVASARGDRVPVAGEAPRAVREQDGPGRVLAGPLRRDLRRVHRVRHQARHRRPHLHPGVGTARRQHHHALAE